MIVENIYNYACISTIRVFEQLSRLNNNFIAIGERVDLSMKKYACAYVRLVSVEIVALHEVANKISEHNVGVVV